MRVSQSTYYNNIFANSNARLNQELFDVNKQIASGLKIQYASDNVRIFAETMRLDNEMVTVGQTKKSIQSGYKVSNQTDVTISEFTKSMNRMRTLLVQAANDTNDKTSRDAIIKELREIEKNLKDLANSSINGQFLFSGSAVNVKPIADDGTYRGNDVGMKAFLGSHNQQKYNITGGELFLGEEGSVNREITSNVVNSNLLGGAVLTEDSPLRDLMGDKNGVSPNIPIFYIRGTRSDGTSFKEKINTLRDTDTLKSLFTKIENIYGANSVNISCNSNGEIVIQDKLQGSSKLDFHMVGAIDYTNSMAGNADVKDIDALATGETTYPPTGNLYIKEFSKSGLVSPTSIEGLTYDRAAFMHNGSIISSNVPQVLKAYNSSTNPYTQLNKNAFATDSTKISDVADAKKEILPSTTPKTYTLDGTQLLLKGTDINANRVNLQIDFKDTGSTFSLDGGVTNYNIYNVDGSQVAADTMTYRQMMDVVNMVETDTLPVTTNSVTDYQTAIENSELLGETSLSYDGKIQFEDLNNANTQATISLYDANTNDFTKNASVMTFNSNNALTVRDPKTDFFKTINEIIQGVESYNNYPDSTSIVKRNVGIENAIAMMDDLQDHIFRTQSAAGAQSNRLSTSLERIQVLEINTLSLRSSVVDTDLAESSLKLSQLTLNYQAMLATVSKVSQLSLVNYM